MGQLPQDPQLVAKVNQQKFTPECFGHLDGNRNTVESTAHNKSKTSSAKCSLVQDVQFLFFY